MTATQTLTEGSTVHINPDLTEGVPRQFVGVPLTLTKMPTRSNERNAVVHGNGDTRGLRIPPSYLLPGSPSGATVEYVPAETPLQRGTVVRLHGKDGVFVITNDTQSRGRTVYQIFPLGGSDRYYRGVSSKQFTVVPLADITVA